MKQVWIKYQIVERVFNDAPSESLSTTLTFNGVDTGYPKYRAFQGWDNNNNPAMVYDRFSVTMAAWDTPPDRGSADTGEGGVLAWRQISVPDDFEIEGDPGPGPDLDNPGDPDDPDDNPIVPVRDYSAHFTSDASGQIYDPNGIPVEWDGAYQALESAGEALTRKMLNIGPYQDFTPYWPVADMIDSVLGRMPDPAAAAKLLRSTLPTLQALNGGGRIASRDAADIAADLNATWWQPQKALADEIGAILAELEDFPSDPAAALAVKHAFAGWSVGMEKAVDGLSESTLQVSTFDGPGFDFIGTNFTRSAKVVGSIFDDTIFLAKGGIAFAGPGHDYIANNYYGKPANKAFTAYGGTGNDAFDGSSKNDVLYGEKGRDSIHGAKGADTMSGGKNADTFYYFVTTESGVGKTKRDYITDFKAGEDKLYFHAKSDTNSGFVDAHYGGKTKVFDGTVGEIIWFQQNKAGTANDRTFVQMDFDGDRDADLQIELKGLIKLTAGDFIL